MVREQVEQQFEQATCSAQTAYVVLAAITAFGCSPLVVLNQGVTINQQVCWENVLNNALLLWTNKQFGNNRWKFQRNPVPSHKAYSTDLNPIDFSIWSILETKLSTKKYKSVNVLKTAIENGPKYPRITFVQLAMHSLRA